MDIYYMYLILVIINGVVAIFAYIISVVTLSTAQEKIYKDLSLIHIYQTICILKNQVLIIQDYVHFILKRQVHLW